MTYFDSIEAAEKAATALLKVGLLTCIGHQLITSQMIGTVNGMTKYMKEVPEESIPKGLYEEYMFIRSIIKLRMEELEEMKNLMLESDPPPLVEFKLSKVTGMVERNLAEYADRMYAALKVGTPSDVSKRLMDMIFTNKDRMGLDTEINED